MSFPQSPVILAAVDQLLVFVLVAIGVAIKNYFDHRAKKNETPPTDAFGGPKTPPAKASVPPPMPTAERRGPLSPEEEKMRKFFEALGLPADAVPPAPVAQPPPKAPPLPRTVPGPTAQPARPAQSAPTKPRPQPAPVRPVTPPPVPGEARSLDSDSSPQVLVGDLHRVDPRYESAKVRDEFRGAARLEVRRTDVHVDVQPDLLGVAPPIVAVGAAHRPVAPLDAGDLTRALRADPAALRRALLLKEILDRPVSLRG